MAGIEEQEFRTSIVLLDGYQFQVSFPDEAMPRLLMDEPEPVGKGEHPNAGLLLAAAVGNCMAASLTYCLRKARAEVKGMRAEVLTKLERDQRGRLRITAMKVVLHPELEDEGMLVRCKDLFEDFCIVSQSVKRGIPVEVEFAPPGRNGP
jgi:uncharacterized OsmC-like protein